MSVSLCNNYLFLLGKKQKLMNFISQQVLVRCVSIVYFFGIDDTLYPQFRSSATTPGKATVKSSARTYFYQDEHKCDENMEHFIKCINTAGKLVMLM